MRFSDLSTVEEVLSHSYISFIGNRSVSVKTLDHYRDSDGNTNAQGFEIVWSNGNKSWLTYWEGDCILVDNAADVR